ncbi:hypothetical protein PRUB_a5382 [Pseudoalteromonas rubra]|uniref:Uncharacterized protein n=1 Tax=Pseudoalteromonas rubra TaxID=43658 RepID=A0A8T0BZN4_9GAMM|nr:hypothetical protein [Pseudoalteromonas rubra]KAF7780964.1 hypothetical protein PRUB_b0026 [Pseudoalteromonas rubra]KAF7789056.1 hypothetical protein PRUB_a5382 [Pseudoalteromonas rubra]
MLDSTPLTTKQDTTFVQSYGIHTGFIPRSQLVKKHWMLAGDDYAKLQGHWHDNALTAIYGNYFVVDKINGVEVSDAQAQATLEELSRVTLAQQFGPQYSNNISFFASDRSVGWEYPVLTPSQAKEISNSLDVIAYNKVLRYAFASAYAYSLEPGGSFAYHDDPLYQKLMLTNGKLEIIDSLLNVDGVYAFAVKVPAIASESLEEEVIIAYKGTNPFNTGDLYEDFKLFFANLAETDIAWQRTAYEFCQHILDQYPPNQASVAPGYQIPETTNSHNVVLTGHSLGGYTAVDSGVRTGIQTRVFASPGTKIIDTYARYFANTMRLRNVINFRTDYDPISSSALRHDENEVEFPAFPDKNLFVNHSLENMIKERLIPLYHNWQDPTARPSQLFITPDASIGAGLKFRTNFWGSTTKGD